MGRIQSTPMSKNTKATYQPAKKTYWKGRDSNPDLDSQYWHQEINLYNIATKTPINNIDIGILGYACDEGVRRNRGRIGAKEGPKKIREQLAKLPLHFNSKNIADFGDVLCIENDLENCQRLFSKHITTLLKNKILPIAIGGGHDMAYAHFSGIYNAVKNTSKNRIGIINFDAHFDLRPVDLKGNSGTPFSQIFNDAKKESTTVKYFAIGIQQQSNTKELFDIANNNNCIEYLINYDCESSTSELNTLKNKLDSFLENIDHLYITIDMDGFSSAYAPGVSAPSPLGFTPYFVFKTLAYLLTKEKVISLDIAELNPSLDRDNATANLAARIIDFTVMNL